MKKLLFIALLSVSGLVFAFTPLQDKALIKGRWDFLSMTLDGEYFYGDRNSHSNSYTWFAIEQFKRVNGKTVLKNGKAVAEKTTLLAVTVNCHQQKIRINSVRIYQGSYILDGMNTKLVSSIDNLNDEFLPTPNTFFETLYNYVCKEKTFFQ